MKDIAIGFYFCMQWRPFQKHNTQANITPWTYAVSVGMKNLHDITRGNNEARAVEKQREYNGLRREKGRCLCAMTKTEEEGGQHTRRTHIGGGVPGGADAATSNGFVVLAVDRPLDSACGRKRQSYLQLSKSPSINGYIQALDQIKPQLASTGRSSTGAAMATEARMVMMAVEMVKNFMVRVLSM